ncbi:MAG TPA: T9SS type A sorting domain-containing protein [Bacteroidia bacterium]|jgi:hypothetical protein|nr:T9SS type A sorting domain-containing protein [Bacteroidia bacterium]
MKKIFFTTILSCLFVGVFSQPAGILNYAGSTTGGGCYTIKYWNDHLFAGAGNTVMVYNTSPVNGNITNFLCEKRLVSNITDMRMYGTYLLVSANHDGIYMFGTSSLPSSLTTEAHYLPDSLSEAAYNLAVKGDTLFVAYKRKMAAFTMDTVAHTFTLISRFGQLPSSLPNARVRGCDAKGNLVAYTVCTYSTSAAADAYTGVYIVNAAQPNYPLLNYHTQTFADPDDVIFGKNTNLLHVLGGTESYAVPTNPTGIFYSLDISNPSTPVQIFTDTIGKFNVTIPYIQICDPMKAENINDTIYVACLGAPDTMNTTNPANGHTYVYKALSNTTVTPLNSIYAGLWHFDIAVNKKKMYIASEWYGIKTVDLTTMATGGTDLGNRLTGGWNKGGDRYGNKLVQANEGYGFRMYDISDPSAPVFLNADSTNQFCWGANFSGDGQYVYGDYYSSNDLRVFNSNSCQLVGSADAYVAFVDPRRSRSWHNKKVSIYHVGFADNIIVADATVPAAPVFEYQRVYNLGETLDLALDTVGNMYILRDDSLTVYDLAGSSHGLKAKIVVPPGTTSNFVTLAVWKDTIYAVVDAALPANDGIYKFYFNGTNALTLIGGPYPLPVQMGIEPPKYAAADSFGVYLVYQDHGLYALAHSNLSQTGYYRHGMEYFRDVDYGPQDLYAKGGILFLHEYFGQTSMFYTDSSEILTGVSAIQPGSVGLVLYPNPAHTSFKVINPFNYGDIYSIDLIDIFGRTVRSIEVRDHDLSEPVEINMSDLAPGTYCVRMNTSAGVCVGKVVKE